MVIFDEECCICFTKPLQKSNVCMLLPCYHCYCIDCITTWLTGSDTCPLCKQITSHLIFNIQSPDLFQVVQLPPRSISYPSSNTDDFNVPFHEHRAKVYHEALQCIVEPKELHVLAFEGCVQDPFTTSRRKPETFKEYFLKNKTFMKSRLERFVRRELETIFHTFNITYHLALVLGVLERYDLFLERQQVEKELSSYLPDKFISKFVEEVGCFVRSRVSLTQYDQQVKYQPAFSLANLAQTMSHEDALHELAKLKTGVDNISFHQ